jgi:hypothetical protein
MQAATYSPSRSKSRRTLVGDRWPGLYERENRRGERVIEFDYYDETGRRRWHTMPVGTTLKVAQAERERFRVKRNEGGRFAPAKAPTISDSWESWIEEASVSLRPRTVVAYRHAFKHRIVPKLGTVKVSQLDRRHIVQFVRSLQQDGRAPWTIRGTIAPLGLYLAWANYAGASAQRSRAKSTAT